MVDISSNLPRAEQGDAAEVTLALETARTLWAEGRGFESVRWIQQAAQNAESAGDDLRAVSLARAAADLRAEMSVASERPGPLNEAAALAPFDDYTEQTIVDSPATALARQSLQSGVQIAEAPSAPLQSSVVVVPSPFTPAIPALGTLPSSMATPLPAAGLGRIAEHQALRVAVLSRDAATRQLSLRVLADDELAPAGSTEALLVTLDPLRKLL